MKINTTIFLKSRMRKNLHVSMAFLLAFLNVDVLYAVPLEALSLDFTRDVTENEKMERIVGTLHYDTKSARVVVEVNEPLKQIMVVKDKVLEIYYPVEKQAFRFISQGRIPLPFVESIIQ